jgi:hypothetical protein
MNGGAIDFIPKPIDDAALLKSVARARLRAVYGWAVISSQERNQCLHVSSGRSSISQCPVSFKSTAVTVVATSFICGPRIAALAFSPAMDRTGIVNLVLAICAKSFAVSGQAPK